MSSPTRQDATCPETSSALPVVQPLTAPGRGAVAAVRAEFPQGADCGIIDRYFQPASRTPASSAAVNQIQFGNWEDEDVVVVRTLARTWEIYCHGGDAAVLRIAEHLNPTGISQNAVDSKSTDSSGRLERDLQALLLKARTTRTAALILAQQRGLLRSTLEALTKAADVESLCKGIESLLSWQSVCQHLVEPWKVAVIGRPNAGKSSILNRIVGFERAIVFDQPGTTRDLVEVTTFLNEWPFRFVDTAGIRDATADPVEAVGVESAREAIATADACLLVVDLVDGWTEEDRQLWHSIENSTNRIPIAVLFNKSDLAESVTADRGEIYPPGPLPNKEGWVFHTSALKNTGIEEVTAWLFCQLLPREPDLQTPLPATREVLDACQSILADCQQDPVACKGQAALASLRQRLKKVLN